MLGANRRERFTYAETIAHDKEALREAYQVWLSFWRDLMLRVSAAGRLLLSRTRRVAVTATSVARNDAGARKATAARVRI